MSQEISDLKSKLAYVNSLFTKLLEQLARIFTERELSEVQEFIDVGEYGLALDTAVDIFFEERKQANEEIVGIVKELATAMELAPENYVGRLIVD